MPKTLLIIGHTGFIGKNVLRLINEKYPSSNVSGISRTTIDASLFPNIKLEQYDSMSAYRPSHGFDFVFFLAHGQASTDPISAEIALEEDFKNLIRSNQIKSPIILILSAGLGSKHLNTRVGFNKRIKSDLPNRIIEIESSVIASPGSISYEIPFRCIQKLHIIPVFPWYKNKVSLTNIQYVLDIYEQIINGDNKNLFYPKYLTTTYGDYIRKIADENNKKVLFLKFPWNEMRVVPYFLSKITNLPYFLVRNLFQSLAVPSIVKDSKTLSTV